MIWMAQNDLVLSHSATPSLTIRLDRPPRPPPCLSPISTRRIMVDHRPICPICHHSTYNNNSNNHHHRRRITRPIANTTTILRPNVRRNLPWARRTRLRPRWTSAALMVATRAVLLLLLSHRLPLITVCPKLRRTCPSNRRTFWPPAITCPRGRTINLRPRRLQLAVSAAPAV